MLARRLLGTQQILYDVTKELALDDLDELCDADDICKTRYCKATY